MQVVKVVMVIEKMYIFRPLPFVLLVVALTFSNQILASSDRFDNIIVIGNSISRHSPSSKLKWWNNWGMAASKEENDYVHLLIDSLQNRGHQANLKIFSASALERGRESAEDFVEKTGLDSFDLIIIQIGDNVKKSPNNFDRFIVDYKIIVSRLIAKNNDARLRCIGLWWGGGLMDSRIKQVCNSFGGVFISLSDISSNIAYQGTNAYPTLPQAVQNHPGDLGMRMISQRIINSIFLLN